VSINPRALPWADMRDALGVAEKRHLIVGVGLAFCSNGEIKRGSLADCPLGPDRPTVPPHNSFHGRQSEMGRTWMVASRTGFHTLEW